MKRALTHRQNNEEKKGDFKVLILILAAIAVAFLVSTFLVRMNDVVGRSMDPTLKDGEWVLIDRVSYQFTKPKRGDIVVFENKEITNSLIVKRIIAVPGDAVELQNGCLFINEKPYEDEFSVRYGDVSRDRFTVPEDCYFVLGDNRSESNDCVSWEEPYIKLEDIQGKVVLKLFPKIERIYKRKISTWE